MSQTMDIQSASSVAGAQVDRLALSANSLAEQAKRDPKQAALVPKQFSKLLATMLVKEMRQALPEGFFGAGAGSDIFDGWLDEHIGAALSENDGMRLEEMIAHSMQIKLDAEAISKSAQAASSTQEEQL
jgi:Rod binding domain-containing protein